MEIHQLLPGLHPGDAISNEALALKRLLRSWGYHSEIYSRDIAYEVRQECLHHREFRPRENCLTIYHYGLGCEEMTRLFLDSPGKRLLIYHNITPHHYLESYNEALWLACKKGREALPDL